MPTVTDPNAPPAYVLNTLHLAGYEEWAVDGEPNKYRRAGGIAKSWRECMEDVAVEYVVLKAKVSDLEMLNAKLASVEPKSGFFTTEFLLAAGTLLPMVGGLVFTVVSEQATTWFPPPYGHMLAVAAAAIAAKIVKDYTGKRTEIKEQAAEQKKQIAVASQGQGEQK